MILQCLSFLAAATRVNTWGTFIILCVVIVIAIVTHTLCEAIQWTSIIVLAAVIAILSIPILLRII